MKGEKEKTVKWREFLHSGQQEKRLTSLKRLWKGGFKGENSIKDPRLQQGGRKNQAGTEFPRQYKTRGARKNYFLFIGRGEKGYGFKATI